MTDDDPDKLNKISEEPNSTRNSQFSQLTMSTRNTNEIEKSHPLCDFCLNVFKDLDESQIYTCKRKLLKKGAFTVENKEEEYFRMCLLTYQLNYKSNQKVLTLNYKALYKEAAIKNKLPLNKWNEWLKKQIDILQFEYIYKKKTEFEYAKIL